mgnify:CR=1 FL=1
MSYEELRKAIQKAIREFSTVNTVENKSKTSTVTTVEKPERKAKRGLKKEVKKRPVSEKRITSDQLRTAYFVLFGKTTRKSNIEVAKEIVSRLREIFGI